MPIKILKLKIIFSAIILMAVFIATCPAKAQSTDILDIEFETGINQGTGLYNPLFTETSILPGESVTRWVEVTNKTGGIIPIATKAVEVTDDDLLGSALILTITEQGTGVPAYSDSLANFFGLDGVYLSDLAGNSTAVYDFMVNFDETTGNEYNNNDGKGNEQNLIFDIVVGDGTDEEMGTENDSSGDYYFRPLSKASPEKYGKELSFTTVSDPDEVTILGHEYPPDLSEEEESASVLGWEGVFAATGFSIKEFVILIIFVFIFSLTAFILKRKEKRKE